MMRAIFILANILALCGASSAQAQTSAAARPAVAISVSALRSPVVPAPTARAPFGCDARSPNVCHFRIFYTRGDRIVILAAGMKAAQVPVIAGGKYCLTLNKSPAFKCTRKVINNQYNS